MKRKVLASVLGAAGLLGLAASSYGQGSVLFDNYGSIPYYPVVYQGSGAGALGNVSVELGYSIGGAAFTLIPGSIGAINPSLTALSGNGSGPATTGYFQLGAQVIPGYNSGSVAFEILAWTTTGGTDFSHAAFNGTLVWTEPSIAGAGLPANNFTALSGPIVLVPTPEPATLALAGLGGLASLVAFRRKQS